MRAERPPTKESQDDREDDRESETDQAGPGGLRSVPRSNCGMSDGRTEELPVPVDLSTVRDGDDQNQKLAILDAGQ